jgi:hypothetical protein
LHPWPTDIDHFNGPIDSLKYYTAQELSILPILVALGATETNQTNLL